MQTAILSRITPRIGQIPLCECVVLPEWHCMEMIDRTITFAAGDGRFDALLNVPACPFDSSWYIITQCETGSNRSYAALSD